MLKQILNVKGVQNLSKEEQQTINGGGKGDPYVCRSPIIVNVEDVCPAGYHFHFDIGHCICCLNDNTYT